MRFLFRTKTTRRWTLTDRPIKRAICAYFYPSATISSSAASICIVGPSFHISIIPRQNPSLTIVPKDPQSLLHCSLAHPLEPNPDARASGTVVPQVARSACRIERSILLLPHGRQLLRYYSLTMAQSNAPVPETLKSKQNSSRTQFESS